METYPHPPLSDYQEFIQETTQLFEDTLYQWRVYQGTELEKAAMIAGIKRAIISNETPQSVKEEFAAIVTRIAKPFEKV